MSFFSYPLQEEKQMPSSSSCSFSPSSYMLTTPARKELLTWISCLTTQKYQLLRKTHHYTISLIDKAIRHIQPETLTKKSLVALSIGCLLVACKAFENWDRKLSLSDLCKTLEYKYTSDELISSEKQVASYFPFELSQGMCHCTFTQVISGHLLELRSHASFSGTFESWTELYFRVLILMDGLSFDKQWAVQDPFLLSLLIVQKCLKSLSSPVLDIQQEWDEKCKEYSDCMSSECQQWLDQYMFEPQTQEEQKERKLSTTQDELDSFFLLQKELPFSFPLHKKSDVQGEEEEIEAEGRFVLVEAIKEARN